jgi:hypothetical protein
MEESAHLTFSVDNLKMPDCTASHPRRPYSRSQPSEPETSGHMLLFFDAYYQWSIIHLKHVKVLLTIENTAKTN